MSSKLLRANASCSAKRDCEATTHARWPERLSVGARLTRNTKKSWFPCARSESRKFNRDRCPHSGRRLTYLGHENGSRGANWQTLWRYAERFRVDPFWLLSGTVHSAAPPRETAVPEPITEALGLAPDATMDEAATAIGALAAAALGSHSAGRQGGMAPVRDRRIEAMLAALKEAWKAADELGREALEIRWRTSFPDLNALSKRNRYIDQRIRGKGVSAS